jgi:DNA-binding NarL/FixJ family response regulator
MPACCVLTSLAGSTELFFILIREAEPSDTARVSKLEQHLRRIAVEVEDSGILLQLNAMPNPARLSQLAGLTERQSEVLSRLMRGERVPTIAKELYVSQSTVRNHLAGIFKHFRVHSQAELLASLANDTRPFAVGARA